MENVISNSTSQKLTFEYLWSLPDDAWVPPEFTAAMIGCSRASLAQWRSSGKGPDYAKRGRLVRYKVSAVKLWLTEASSSTN